MNFKLFEAVENFAMVANFPKGKPIYTYPTNMTPAGELQLTAEVKEMLMAELEERRIANGIESHKLKVERLATESGHLLLHSQNAEPVAALRVIVGIGRSGNFRKLHVPGEELNKVSNRLHDPKDFARKQVLVVGGGDSALETAIALVCCGSHVTLSYRKAEFSRPKPDNLKKLRELEKDAAHAIGITVPTSERITTAVSSEMRGENPPGSLIILMGSHVQEIHEKEVLIETSGGDNETIENDSVFVMTGGKLL